MIATVLWGANNIYNLLTNDRATLEHVRLKGKKLPGTEGEHNPLAPGDRVEVDGASAEPRILRRIERKNTVVRWNRTRRRMQAVAANVDLLCLVASLRTPDYRPAFVDRVLVMAELQRLPVLVVLNKADLPAPPRAEEHAAALVAAGYQVLRTVATGAPQVESLDPGIRSLATATADLRSVFFGQSGVGKSSIINRLVPEADLLTGEISHRYRRGRHTTTLARQVIARGDRRIVIDTPGVREFDLFGYAPADIAWGFREFRPHVEGCRLRNCTHIHEPGCAVRAAVAAGTVPDTRYDSYRRMMTDFQGSLL